MVKILLIDTFDDNNCNAIVHYRDLDGKYAGQCKRRVHKSLNSGGGYCDKHRNTPMGSVNVTSTELELQKHGYKLDRPRAPKPAPESAPRPLSPNKTTEKLVQENIQLVNIRDRLTSEYQKVLHEFEQIKQDQLKMVLALKEEYANVRNKHELVLIEKDKLLEGWKEEHVKLGKLGEKVQGDKLHNIWEKKNNITYEKILGKLDDISTKYVALKRIIEDSDKNLVDITSKKDELLQKLNDCNRELKAKTDELKTCQQKNGKYSNNIGIIREKLKNCEKQLSECAKEKSELVRKMSKNNKELTRVQTHVNNLRYINRFKKLPPNAIKSLKDYMNHYMEDNETEMEFQLVLGNLIVGLFSEYFGGPGKMKHIPSEDGTLLFDISNAPETYPESNDFDFEIHSANKRLVVTRKNLDIEVSYDNMETATFDLLKLMVDAENIPETKEHYAKVLKKTHEKLPKSGKKTKAALFLAISAGGILAATNINPETPSGKTISGIKDYFDKQYTTVQDTVLPGVTKFYNDVATNMDPQSILSTLQNVYNNNYLPSFSDEAISKSQYKTDTDTTTVTHINGRWDDAIQADYDKYSPVVTQNDPFEGLVDFSSEVSGTNNGTNGTTGAPYAFGGGFTPTWNSDMSYLNSSRSDV